jgi:16S rRNA G966 N2-methylase RsmD
VRNPAKIFAFCARLNFSFCSQLYNANILRSCFYDDSSDASERNDIELAEKLKSLVREDLERQLMVVRGSDGESRSIVYKPPRESPTNADENEAYVATQIYTAERAIATTEYISRGQQEKLFVVFSFENYLSSNSVSIAAMKESSRILQRLYPERLEKLVILDPPFWMRAIVALVSPLLSLATRKKMKLVSGEVRPIFCDERASRTFLSKPQSTTLFRRKKFKRRWMTYFFTTKKL